MLFWFAARFISLPTLKSLLSDTALQKEIIFLTTLQQNIFGQSFILLGKGLFFYLRGYFMPVKIIATEQRVTAFLEGEIDHHTASTLRMEIDDAIQTYKPKVLKLDYADVTFMDSSGVGLVMGRVRTMSPFGGKIIVSNLSPQTYRVMQLAGLEKIAKISKREDVSNESKK